LSAVENTSAQKLLFLIFLQALCGSREKISWGFVTIAPLRFRIFALRVFGMVMPEPQRPDDQSAQRDFLFAAVVLGCVFCGLLAMTWRKWPDMMLDFGLQLYMPWKISTGAVIYRDLAYMTGGPFSQYLDAVLFHICGVSFLTLAMFNLGLLVLLLLMVYRCFYRAADQLTALMCCLAILLVFAFGHYSDYGIFNYVTPYCEEVYQGLILSIAAVALLAKWAATQKNWAALAAGFCSGLVFLTKPEVFLALAAAVFAGFLLAWRVTGKSRTALKGLGLLAVAGAVPSLAFLIYFLQFANFQKSLAWTCWAWVPVLTTRAADSPLFRWCLGLDTPGAHLARMFGDYLGLGAIIFAAALIFRRRTPKSGLADYIFLAVAAPLMWLAWKFDWVECGHSLPLLCLTTLAALGWRAKRSGWNPPAIFISLWSVFSLVLLAKLGLYSRIWHYGFALAMPAFLTALYLLLWLVPEFLRKFNVASGRWRTLACLLLATGFAQLILFSKFVYQQKTVAVGEGADMLWTFGPDFQPTKETPGQSGREGFIKGQTRPAGLLMGQALTWMQSNTPPNSTVTVMPAGIMLNYMLRRSNPTPYMRWNPPELAVFGQDNMNRAVEEAKPDYIVVLGVDTTEFGVHFFGDSDSFGRELMHWISQSYKPVCWLGHDWNKDGEFGIEILKRSE
jgi:4-amino-4-deoxy-L-arabinose transferase-like glycosyltransferase